MNFQVSSQELANDVTGAEALLERHQVYIIHKTNLELKFDSILGIPHGDQRERSYVPGIQAIRPTAAQQQALRQ